MPENAVPSTSPSDPPADSLPDARDVSARSPSTPPVWHAYGYALVRVVPRVERGECINVGAVLFARGPRHLAAAIELDPARVLALAPDLNLTTIERHLASFLAIAHGRPEGGPLADLPPAERFHWLTAPRSTMIQTSPAHVGRTIDLAAELDRLMDAYVR